MATYNNKFSIKIKNMQDDNNNKKIIIKTLGALIKYHRMLKNKTIYKISAESSISKSTWREAELGVCNDITLSTLWKISEGLEIPLDILIKELYKKLGTDFTLID